MGQRNISQFLFLPPPNPHKENRLLVDSSTSSVRTKERTNQREAKEDEQRREEPKKAGAFEGFQLNNKALSLALLMDEATLTPLQKPTQKPRTDEQHTRAF